MFGELPSCLSLICYLYEKSGFRIDPQLKSFFEKIKKLLLFDEKMVEKRFLPTSCFTTVSDKTKKVTNMADNPIYTQELYVFQELTMY